MGARMKEGGRDKGRGSWESYALAKAAAAEPRPELLQQSITAIIIAAASDTQQRPSPPHFSHPPHHELPRNTSHLDAHDTPAMDRLSRMLAAAQGMGGMGGGPAQDTNLIDNSETVYISSLALLKMLRHGRAGVPMEVMGLMLGEFVDDYTVRVVDVFAMPQSGTGVSVEAVDPVFQTKMMDMLRQTGRWEPPVFTVSVQLLTSPGKRRSSAGTTHIPASAAGCRRSTSTHSSRSSS